MSEEDLRSLVDLGLTTLQARAYIALLGLGNCKVREVSSTLGIVRSEAYRILRDLSFAGLAQHNPESPSTYVGTPPKLALHLLMSRLTQRYQALKHRNTELMMHLESYASETERRVDERFNIIAGGNNVIQRQLQMLKGVRSDYVAILSKWGLNRLGGGGVLGEESSAAIRAAKRRQVKIRIIAEIDPNRKIPVSYRTMDVRYLTDLPFYLNIFDKREMLIGHSPLRDEEITQRNYREAEIWTNNSKFIGGMYEIFEKLWRGTPKYLPHRKRSAAVRFADVLRE